MRYLIFPLTLLLIFIACLGPDHRKNIRCQPKYFNADQSSYDVYPNSLTAKNIAVDTSGLNINMDRVDRLVDETENCLIQQFGNPPVLSALDMESGQCEFDTFQIPFHRECLTVKIAANWTISKYDIGGEYQQLLPYTNGGTCKDKNLPDPEAVCYYRAAVQDQLTIVVPPSMYLFKDPLVRIVTGCHNPWYNDKLSYCMTPSTGSMDDGSGP